MLKSISNIIIYLNQIGFAQFKLKGHSAKRQVKSFQSNSAFFQSSNEKSKFKQLTAASRVATTQLLEDIKLPSFMQLVRLGSMSIQSHHNKRLKLTPALRASSA